MLWLTVAVEVVKRVHATHTNQIVSVLIPCAADQLILIALAERIAAKHSEMLAADK